MKINVHNVHFWLVGALLQTPFSSRTRPWELRCIDGIDLFDVFCTPIRYETRKNGLLRAVSYKYNSDFIYSSSGNYRGLALLSVELDVPLEVFSPFFNTVVRNDPEFIWINDRARFFLDSIEKQRILKPMIQGYPLFPFLSFMEKKSPRAVSWVMVLGYLKREIYFSLFLENFSFNNWKRVIFKKFFFAGNFLDSFSILNFKFFSNRLGVSNIFTNLDYSNFLNTDFRRDFLFNKSAFFSSDCVVLFGVDLRLENPTFNLQLKDFSKNSRIFSFGALVNPIYKVDILGVSFFDIMKFFKGIHYFSNRLYNLFRRPFFLFGNSLLEVDGVYDYCREYFSLLKNTFLFENITFSLLPRYITSIAAFEFGLQPGINSENTLISNKDKDWGFLGKNPLEFFFFYSFNADFNHLLPLFLNFYNNNNFFSVYHGSYFNDFAMNANILLPSDFVLEKNSKFLSVDGKLVTIFNNFKYSIQNLNDYDFFRFFLMYCRPDFKGFFDEIELSSFFSFVLHKRVGNLWRLSFFPNLCGDFRNTLSFGKSLISNFVTGNLVFNFFLSEPICRNSQTMVFASKYNSLILKKRKYNYDV